LEKERRHPALKNDKGNKRKEDAKAKGKYETEIREKDQEQ